MFRLKLSNLKTGWFWFGNSPPLNDYLEKKRKKNLVYHFSKLEPSPSQTLWETLGAIPGLQGDRPSGGVGVPRVGRLTAGLLDGLSDADAQPRWPAPYCAGTLAVKSAAPAPTSLKLSTINWLKWLKRCWGVTLLCTAITKWRQL